MNTRTLERIHCIQNSFQARDLSTGPEKAKIRNIEQNMDLLRIVAPSLDPTIGPPVVYNMNNQYFVLAGNGRTIAFKRWLMQDDGEHAYSKNTDISRIGK